MTNQELAAYLAHKVFGLADTPKDRVQRLQLKGGKWPDNETDMGGLCESALAGVLQDALNDAATEGKGASHE